MADALHFCRLASQLPLPLQWHPYQRQGGLLHRRLPLCGQHHPLGEGCHALRSCQFYLQCRSSSIPPLNWSEVWTDATGQILFSLGAGIAALPTLASFNRFHKVSGCLLCEHSKMCDFGYVQIIVFCSRTSSSTSFASPTASHRSWLAL